MSLPIIHPFTATPATHPHRAPVGQRRPRIAHYAALLGLALAAIGTCASAATTWTVTTNQDDNPAVSCNTSSHECYTLRDALFTAVDGDTIDFDLSSYTLPTTINLAYGA
ncbi:MAG: hypothetical protein L0H70_04235, partial [Xanthomonadales bacterium]|nr:hypothetical protein [Xanthomonadales bacterium]